jgi:hypothetical protein
MGMRKLDADTLEARKKRKKRVTRKKGVENADWVAIRALYLGGMKSDALAEKFGVPANYIRARASQEKWLESALAATPKLVAKNILKNGAEATGKLISEIWAERGEAIREKEFKVAEKIANYAEHLEEPVLLNKIDKVKIALDMGRRSTGLDKVESNPNAVNIAVLGEVGVFDGEAEIFKKKANPPSLP